MVNTMLGMCDLNPGTDFALFKPTTPCKYPTHTFLYIYQIKQLLIVITEKLKIAHFYSPHKIKFKNCKYPSSNLIYLHVMLL